MWVAKSDAEAMLPEQTIRLMELFNIEITETGNCINALYKSEAYEDVRKIKVQLIQWVPKGTEYPAQVIQQDASVTEGFAESACKKLKPDQIIQFERYGFVRVEEVGKKITTYYAQK